MEEIINYPILFNKTKNRKWKLWVVIKGESSFIYRTDGLISKNFEKAPSIKEIKGKTKTSSKEQCLIEAKKTWIKKTEGGFIPADNDEEGNKMYKDLMELKNSQGGNLHNSSKTGIVGSSKTISSIKKEPKIKADLSKLDKDLQELREDIEEINDEEYVRDVPKIEPMLAHPYNEKSKRVIWSDEIKEEILSKIKKTFKSKLQYKKLNEEALNNEVLLKANNDFFFASDGAFIQPKVDGVRNISMIINNKLVCLSRNSKQFKFLNEQKKEIYNFLKNSSFKEPIILDGEWYSHSPILKDSNVPLTGNKKFDFISSCCRTTLNKPNPNENLIHYVVFDIIDYKKTQIERFKILRELFSSYKNKLNYILPCQIHVVSSEEELKEYHDKVFKEGYEGVMLRNPNSMYEGKRSLNLLKYKEFEDKEFVIIGAKEAQGTKKGCVIWICQTDSGNEFTCNMGDGCSFEKQKDYFENYVNYLREKLTVKYQGLGENGIPRFPVGIAIRNYE